MVPCLYRRASDTSMSFYVPVFLPVDCELTEGQLTLLPSLHPPRSAPKVVVNGELTILSFLLPSVYYNKGATVSKPGCECHQRAKPTQESAVTTGGCTGGPSLRPL